MWLPLTSLMAAGAGVWSADCKTCADPRPGGVDQRARSNLADLPAAFVPHGQGPQTAVAVSAYATGAGRDDGALVGRVARVQNHEPGVFGPAIRIFEPKRVLRLERFARWVIGQSQRSSWRQQPAPADMIVEKKAEPKQPCGSEIRMVGQHKAKRPHDMGRDSPQNFALDERLANQTKLEML